MEYTLRGDIMNYIFGGMIIISIISAIITGRVDETVNAIFEGANTAAATFISFAGAMCFWTGIMRVAQASGAADAISKVLSPVIRKLFPTSSEKTREYISLNMTANLLGMGNAATPMGIMAVEEMDKENSNPTRPTRDMCMLVCINTAAFQLVPSTIIALRAGAGSIAPTSVIVPIWIASMAGLISAVIAVSICRGRRPAKRGTL